MDAGEAWHFLITHCRDLEVCCGSARVKITVSDDGWHTVTRHDGVEERADGTYTHDLLTYLAYVSRKADAPARPAQGQPFEATESLWVSHSDWNANFSTSDGRRLHVYNEAGTESILPLVEFQSSQP